MEQQAETEEKQERRRLVIARLDTVMEALEDLDHQERARVLNFAVSACRDAQAKGVPSLLEPTPSGKPKGFA